MLRGLFRLLLFLYPPDVRRRFGRDLIDCFDDLVRGVSGRRRAAIAIRAILDLPRSAFRARLRPGRTRRAGGSPSTSRGAGMESIWRDLRYAVRGLLRQPGLAALATASLALGIGANTTMISSVNGLLGSRLPVPEPDRLIRLYEHDGTFSNFSYPNYRDIRETATTLAEISVHSLNAFAIHRDGASEIAYGELVSSNYFEMLRVSASQGRTFSAAEGDARAPVVVLSHPLWQRAFGGEPNVVGTAIRVNGHTMTVVGIAEVGFPGTKFGLAMDLWVPIESWGVLEDWNDLMDARDSQWLEVVGRLAPNATRTQAQEELSALAARLASEYPRTNANRTFRVMDAGLPVPEAQGLPQLIGALAIAASSMVLLVACANVASLLLARGVIRRREIGIRRALGAGRARIVRLLLTESVLLAGAGGALGIALAYWTSGFLWWFMPALPYRFAIDTAPDTLVLAVAASVTLSTALVFGLAPALHAVRDGGASAVRGDAASGATDRPAGRRLQLLVTAMIALAFVTLLMTGLFGRSLTYVRSVDPGFASGGRLLATLDASLVGYEADRAVDYFETVEQRVRALPGVRAAAFGEIIPLSDRSASMDVFAGDRTYAQEDPGVEAMANRVTPEYFSAMDITVLDGRSFAVTDRADGPQVVVINETLARMLWPEGEAVGRRLRYSPTGEGEMEVVGVVADGRYVSIAEPQRAAVYRPLAQARRRSMELIVETAGSPGDMTAAVRSAVTAVDPLVPVHNVRTISEHLTSALWMFRLGAGLGAALGGLALVLATAGLYGVMTFSVNQRRHEIGLRMALGARASQVVRVVLRQALRMVGLGIAAGVVVALLIGGSLRAMLVGVEPLDPVTFIGVIVILLGVAMLASVLPARSALRADPVKALRAEA